MKILTSGCSFTFWPKEPGSAENICWPSQLSELRPQDTITNLAEPGAGNLYISNSVIDEICSKPNEYGLVLVMWSGVSRLDFLTDLTNPGWQDLFVDYNFYRRLPGAPEKLGYIFSGGNMGIWYQSQTGRKIFNELYKISGNLSLAYTNLIEIVKCQDFLRARGIPYKFMSYVNYWTDQGYLSPNGDFGVMAFPELRNLINQIDFGSWIFSDDQRNGIYEMAKEAGDYHGDRFHPGPETHRRWASLVNKKLSV